MNRHPLSKRKEYDRVQKSLNSYLTKLEHLKNNTELKKELKLEQQLKELLAQYNKNTDYLLNFISPPALIKAYRKACKVSEAGSRMKAIKQSKQP